MVEQCNECAALKADIELLKAALRTMGIDPESLLRVKNG